jgi:hypothetical protein
LSRPGVERGALLGCPIVPLVRAGDAAAAAADVVRHRFGHFEPDAKTLQSGCDGPAQIVQAQIVQCPRDKKRSSSAGRSGSLGTPIHYCGVESPLCLGSVSKRRPHCARQGGGCPAGYRGTVASVRTVRVPACAAPRKGIQGAHDE